MPYVLLTLASEGVRGKAFPPEWQVPGNCVGALISSAKDRTKCLQQLQWIIVLNGKLASAQTKNSYTATTVSMSFSSNLNLGFYPELNMYRVDSERGECRAFTANNLLLQLLCNMHALHKLCSATRDIQSTYVTSNNSSPSPCSPEREPVMCEFGCRDGCVLWRQSHLPVSHYRSSSTTDAYCCVS